MSLGLKCHWGDLCLVQTYSLLHCHMTNSHLWQLLIGDHLENTHSPCRLTQIPKHLHYSTHKNILLPFGLSWAVFWWIKNTLKCWIPLVLRTTMCMWFSIQSQLAKFYKERGKSIKHIRQSFSICVIQLNTCSWLSGSVPHIVLVF